MTDLCKIKQDLSGLVLQRLLTKIVKHNSRPFGSDGLTVFFEKKSFETSRTKKKKQENINSLHYYYILMNEPATTLKKYLQQTEQIKMKR